MPDLRVTLTALVAGNPNKAWRGSTGPDDTENVPDDVWEDKEFTFDSLDDAVEFVSRYPADNATTTHVKIYYNDPDLGVERLIFEQDAGDDLASVTLDPPEPEPEPETDDIPAAPPLPQF